MELDQKVRDEIALRMKHETWVEDIISAVEQWGDECYNAGEVNGEEHGYDRGFDDGMKKGHNEGYDKGYDEGTYNGYEDARRKVRYGLPL